MFKDRLLIGIFYIFQGPFKILFSIIWIFFDIDFSKSYDKNFKDVQEKYIKHYEERKNKIHNNN